MKYDKYKVIISLKVPAEFIGIGKWKKQDCLYDFVSHWLTEGYYNYDQIVELPEGIKYTGFKILKE